MATHTKIKTIFTDIGGVLLTDGWNRHARKKAAEMFHLNLDDFEERHHLTFDTYEEGKLTLEEYLRRIVFYQERSFTMEEFKEFMLAQSAPHKEMINLLINLKKRFRTKIAVISNEGRELSYYRINQFGLTSFVDFFVSSGFVGMRKPDTGIFQMALDMAQTKPEECVYIEDREMFVQVAAGLGINGIWHQDYDSTMKELAEYGLIALESLD